MATQPNVDKMPKHVHVTQPQLIMDRNSARHDWSQQQNHPNLALSLQSDAENQFLPPNLPGHPAMGFNLDNGYDMWQYAPPSAEELAELARQARPGPLMPSHQNRRPPVLADPPLMIVPSQKAVHPNPTPSRARKPVNAQTPAKTPAQSSKKRATGKGSKSGKGNRRDGGDSDEEIAKLTKAQMDAAAIKIDLTDVKPENPRGLTEKDKLAAVQYIVAPEQWAEFRLMQASVFIHVSYF